MTLVINRGRLTKEKWFSPSLRWRDAFCFVLYKQVRHATTTIGFIKEHFDTIHIDLTLPKDEIFSQFSQTTRNEIRRAEKQGVLVDEISIDEFSKFFATFAVSADISPLDEAARNRYGEHLYIMKAALGDVSLAMVCCLLDQHGKRARLFKAATARQHIDDARTQKQMGYANRLLQWCLIQQLRKSGFLTYDLGGCVVNSDNQRLNNIGKYKLGFSKNIVTENNFCSVPLYLKWKILRGIARLRNSGVEREFRDDADAARVP